MIAIIREEEEILGRLLSLDVYADVNCADDNGDTPLIIACRDANADIVKMLLHAGAKVNLQNKNGMSALMACAQNGDKTMMGDLMKAGADCYLKDAEGCLVGDYAVRGNHGDMISFIANFQCKKGAKQ